MRLMPVVVAAFVLAAQGPAFAQEWTEFASLDESLYLQFPGPTDGDGDHLDLGIRRRPAGARL